MARGRYDNITCSNCQLLGTHEQYDLCFCLHPNRSPKFVIYGQDWETHECVAYEPKGSAATSVLGQAYEKLARLAVASAEDW